MADVITPARFLRERVFGVPTQDAFALMLRCSQAQVSRMERSGRISRRMQDRMRELAAQQGLRLSGDWFFEVPGESREASRAA